MLVVRKPQRQLLGDFLFEQMILANHPLREIDAILDLGFVNEELAHLYSPEEGRPAVDPETMVRLELLQYLYDLSDRELVANLQVNVAFRWFARLSAIEEVVDDTTLCVFRKRLGAELHKQLFDRVLDQARQASWVKERRHLMDATHIRADIADRRPAEALAQANAILRRDISRLAPARPLPQAAATPKRFAPEKDDVEKVARETQELIAQGREVLRECGQPPSPLAERLSGELEVAKAVLTGVLHPDEPERPISMVDPDARVGAKSRSHHFIGYKAALVMDADSYLITAVDVVPGNRNDSEHMLSLVDDELGRGLQPVELVADSGYASGPNRAGLADRSILPTIPVRKKNHRCRLFPQELFTFDPETMTVRCPANQVTGLHFSHRKPDYGWGETFTFPKRACAACSLRAQCTGPINGRRIWINQHYKEEKAARERMKSPEWREALLERRRIEPKHAELKRFHGLGRARYRGLPKVRIQAYLTALVANLKRIAKLAFGSLTGASAKVALGRAVI